MFKILKKLLGLIPVDTNHEIVKEILNPQPELTSEPKNVEVSEIKKTTSRRRTTPVKIEIAEGDSVIVKKRGRPPKTPV